MSKMGEEEKEGFVMRDSGDDVVGVEEREEEEVEEETEDERAVREKGEQLALRRISEGPGAPMMQGEQGGNLGYDSEWVRFLDQLSNDESMSTIVHYINKVQLTSRAKEKLIVYITTILDREFAVSRIENNEDYLKLLDKKQILDCDLPLGLTRFDISPEFTHIIDLIAIKWDIKIRRSMGAGFERKILATSRTENISEERVRNMSNKKSTSDKVRGLFEK